MTMHMRPFRSINRISKWLVNWSIASIVTTFIFMVIASYQNVQFFITGEGKFLEGGPGFILGTIDGAIGFVAIILMLYWFYNASKNKEKGELPTSVLNELSGMASWVKSVNPERYRNMLITVKKLINN